jgi:hypothetical protein
MGLGSEMRDLKEPIADPGSRDQKGTRSRIRIRNTEFSLYNLFQYNLVLGILFSRQPAYRGIFDALEKKYLKGWKWI